MLAHHARFERDETTGVAMEDVEETGIWQLGKEGKELG